MGKLYLASFTFKANDGERVEQRLVHVDISRNDMTDHQKALQVRDWLSEIWWPANNPDIELSGCAVKTTIDWSHKDEEPRADLYKPVEFTIKYGPETMQFVIGDGVHDGFYGQGETAGAKAIDFLEKLKNDDQYVIVKRA